jgi:glycosyltransferase involved in cell wall biosynthesis
MKARILIASMAFDAERGGGGNRLMYDLAVGLARRGHKIIVVCEDQFDRGLEREDIGGITVFRYRLPPSNKLNIRSPKDHMDAVKRLLNNYVLNPPDIVHGHNLFQSAAVFERFYNRSRCCYTIHSPAEDEARIAWGSQGILGKLKSFFGLSIIRRIESEILANSSVLTAESQYTVRCIAQNYNSAVAGKIRVIPGWVDMSIFKPLIQEKTDEVRQHLGWPMDSPVFFVLRRLEARMGLDNLLRALAIVKKRGFHPHTVIGGSGSLRVFLEKLRDELGLHKCVCFMGFVPASILPQAYAACDASIIPTAQLECFGIIALEALACGKTTLVTPVGALPEVMRNFQPEWIARDSTAEGIADLMCSFLNKSLPPFSYRDVQDVIKKKYSFECALTAYERLFFE